MKPDRILSRKQLFTAAEVARLAEVQGKKKIITVDGVRTLAVETPAKVYLRLAAQDLSPFNQLVVTVRQTRIFECSLDTHLECSTRAPGIAGNDGYAGIPTDSLARLETRGHAHG